MHRNLNVPDDVRQIPSRVSRQTVWRSCLIAAFAALPVSAAEAPTAKATVPPDHERLRSDLGGAYFVPKALKQEYESRICHKMPELQRIQVQSDNGTVTIRGNVSSFYQRQLCINCSRRVAGVVRLVDELTVLSASNRQFSAV